MTNWLLIQVAGLWPLIWHFGIGVGLLILCGAGFYFSPIHRTDFLWAALVIAAVMAATAFGVRLGEKQVYAQWNKSRVVLYAGAQKARADGVRDAARKPHRWLPNKPDQYNRDGGR